MRRHTGAELALLLLVVALAAGLRVYYLGTLADDGRGPEPMRVQEAPSESFTVLIKGLSQGRGFVNGSDRPTADVAPLYPWLISQLSRTAEEPALLFERTRWLQCGLGALTAGLLFLFARQAFHSLATATLAGLLAAVYPFWIVASAEIGDGVLAAFFVALSLYLFARSRCEEFGASWLLGLALAGMALTRAALLPYALVSLLAFLNCCRSRPGRSVPALLAVFGFASGMAPWALRNYEAFHDIIPVVETTYLHLWIGNHPGATGGPVSDGVPADPAARATEVSSTIANEPAATLQRRLWAGLAFLVGDAWLREQRLFDGVADAAMPEETRHFFERALPASLLLLFALAFLGWRWSYGSRDDMAAATLAVVFIPLPYVLGHAERLSGPRLPLDGVLLCLASYAVIWVIAGLRGLRGRDL